MLTGISFLAPLLTRIVLGQAFFLTGRGKWMNFENTVDFFTQLGIPFAQANAGFISTLEMVGGLLLIIGLMTRPIAALLSSTMIVALLTADKQAFLEAFGSDLTGVTPVVYLMLLAWLVFQGPGLLSFDTIIARRIFAGTDFSSSLGNNHPIRADVS